MVIEVPDVAVVKRSVIARSLAVYELLISIGDHFSDNGLPAVLQRLY